MFPCKNLGLKDIHQPTYLDVLKLHQRWQGLPSDPVAKVGAIPSMSAPTNINSSSRNKLTGGIGRISADPRNAHIINFQAFKCHRPDIEVLLERQLEKEWKLSKNSSW